jgi:hypothetical protein
MSELDAAFAIFNQPRIDALIVAGEAFFLNRRGQLVELAARLAVPTMYHLREMAAAGGLMSYGGTAWIDYTRVAVVACRRGDRMRRSHLSAVRRLDGRLRRVRSSRCRHG